MKKFLTIIFIVMFFNFQVSAQWTERSWLGWYDQIWGASSNYASFTFTEHQTGFKIAGGAGLDLHGYNS